MTTFIILISFLSFIFLLNLYILDLKSNKYCIFTINITKRKIKDIDALYKIINGNYNYNYFKYSIVKHEYMTKIFTIKTFPFNNFIRVIFFMIPFIFLFKIKYTGYIKRSHVISFDSLQVTLETIKNEYNDSLEQFYEDKSKEHYKNEEQKILDKQHKEKLNEKYFNLID